MSQQSARRTTAGRTVRIEDARIVTADRVIDGSLSVADGRIASIDPDGDDSIADRSIETADPDHTIDARGRLLLPGLVDLHGDDIESHLAPRTGMQVDPAMALASADRANLAAGITTKFHAVSFETDPDAARSPELGADLAAAIGGSGLLADHRLHARCEVTQERCVTAVDAVLRAGEADLVSVMSHVPGKGQFRDEEAFKQYYRDSAQHSIEEAEALIDQRGDVTLATLRERVDRILERAQAHDVPAAAHDDEDPAEVDRLADAGVTISEYPITLPAAERAQAHDLTVAMGAPNLVRGESQWGNLRTADAIDAEVVDVLVADYHPASLLAAPFVDTGEPLPQRVARVTSAPAAAAGLADRGRIEVGARADLIVVAPEPTPTVAHALVGGVPVYRATKPRVEAEHPADEISEPAEPKTEGATTDRSPEDAP